MKTVVWAPAGFCRVEDVGVAVGVSASTIQRWIRQQRLCARKVHGVWLIPQTELVRFAQKYRSGVWPWAWEEGVLADIFPEGLDL